MRTLRNVGLSSLAVACMISFGACSSMTNTGKGALIGGGGAGVLGAGIGALIDGGKGAGIGAAIGTAIGAGAGALIGHKMDQQKAELERELAQQAKIESVTDSNGLQAIRVTFDGGILFPTNGTTLSANAQKDLTEFASNLIQNPGTDIKIYGYTDDTGTMAVNTRIADGRADAVLDYLLNSGVAASRMTAQGRPMTDYIASNATPEGRAQNRRVEVYIVAGQQMINAANAGTL